MLSGRDISSRSFSGIAWLDQYCQNGRRFNGSHTIGSYSYNALGVKVVGRQAQPSSLRTNWDTTYGLAPHPLLRPAR